MPRKICCIRCVATLCSTLCSTFMEPFDYFCVVHWCFVSTTTVWLIMTFITNTLISQRWSSSVRGPIGSHNRFRWDGWRHVGSRRSFQRWSHLASFWISNWPTDVRLSRNRCSQDLQLPCTLERSTTRVAQTSACSLINSQLNYCNSLLYGGAQETTTKVGRAQNNAVRVTLAANRRSGARPVLCQLHMEGNILTTFEDRRRLSELYATLFVKWQQVDKTG